MPVPSRLALASVLLTVGCTHGVTGAGPEQSTSPTSPNATADGGVTTAGGLRVFVTKATYSGDLTLRGGEGHGLDAGDALCQVAAEGAQLDGRFVAYLASKNADAIDRIKDDGPFLTLKGTVAYRNRSALGAAISIPLTNESGDEPSMNDGFSTTFWSGASAAGRATEAHCNGWTSDSPGYLGTTASPRGTTTYDFSCSGSYHLLCVEQKRETLVPKKKVFVTSAAYDGNLGSAPLDTADAHCMEAANDGGLKGTFVAWLSAKVDGKTVRAIDRVTDARYEMLDGRMAFYSKRDMTDTAMFPLEITEQKTKVPFGAQAWTGTMKGGGPAAANCKNWSTSDHMQEGSVGTAGADGAATWSGSATDGAGFASRCDTKNRLYCFEL